jgi:hypothetical protein
VKAIIGNLLRDNEGEKNVWKIEKMWGKMHPQVNTLISGVNTNKLMKTFLL